MNKLEYNLEELRQEFDEAFPPKQRKRQRLKVYYLAGEKYVFVSDEAFEYRTRLRKRFADKFKTKKGGLNIWKIIVNLFEFLSIVWVLIEPWILEKSEQREKVLSE